MGNQIRDLGINIAVTMDISFQDEKKAAAAKSYKKSAYVN